MKVWIVHFVDDWEQYVFSSAEKAYNCIVDRLYESFDTDDGVDKMKEKLTADYNNYPDGFGVEDYASAEMVEVDEYC